MTHCSKQAFLQRVRVDVETEVEPDILSQICKRFQSFDPELKLGFGICPETQSPPPVSIKQQLGADFAATPSAPSDIWQRT